MARTTVTRKAAEAFINYYDSFNDGENLEEYKYELQCNGDSCKVMQYYWSVSEQRRVYVGYADIPARFDSGVAFQ